MLSGQLVLQRLLPLIVLGVAVVSVPVMIFSAEGLARLRALEEEKRRADEEISRLSAQTLKPTLHRGDPWDQAHRSLHTAREVHTANVTPNVAPPGPVASSSNSAPMGRASRVPMTTPTPEPPTRPL